MKYTIEISEKELQLISNALDLYSRLNIVQFLYLRDVPTLHKYLHENNLFDVFTEKCNELSKVFRYSNNYGPGIFNKTVDPSAVIAFDMHQTIRHQFYLDRNDQSIGTVDAYPAEACKTARIDSPNFKITKNDT